MIDPRSSLSNVGDSENFPKRLKSGNFNVGLSSQPCRDCEMPICSHVHTVCGEVISEIVEKYSDNEIMILLAEGVPIVEFGNNGRYALFFTLTMSKSFYLKLIKFDEGRPYMIHFTFPLKYQNSVVQKGSNLFINYQHCVEFHEEFGLDGYVSEMCEMLGKIVNKKKSKTFQVRVVRRYESRKSTEMSLFEDEIIEVIDDNDNLGKMYFGVCQGRLGFFPACCVEKIEEEKIIQNKRLTLKILLQNAGKLFRRFSDKNPPPPPLQEFLLKNSMPIPKTQSKKDDSLLNVKSERIMARPIAPNFDEKKTKGFMSELRKKLKERDQKLEEMEKQNMKMKNRARSDGDFKKDSTTVDTLDCRKDLHPIISFRRTKSYLEKRSSFAFRQLKKHREKISFPKGSPSKNEPVENSNQSSFFIVQYDFKSENDDEMDLMEDQTIEVLSRPEREWFLGRCVETGREGLFPINFCNPITFENVGPKKESEVEKKAPLDPLPGSEKEKGTGIKNDIDDAQLLTKKDDNVPEPVDESVENIPETNKSDLETIDEKKEEETDGESEIDSLSKKFGVDLGVVDTETEPIESIFTALPDGKSLFDDIICKKEIGGEKDEFDQEVKRPETFGRFLNSEFELGKDLSPADFQSWLDRVSYQFDKIHEEGVDCFLETTNPKAKIDVAAFSLSKANEDPDASDCSEVEMKLLEKINILKSKKNGRKEKLSKVISEVNFNICLLEKLRSGLIPKKEHIEKDIREYERTEENEEIEGDDENINIKVKTDSKLYSIVMRFEKFILQNKKKEDNDSKGGSKEKNEVKTKVSHSKRSELRDVTNEISFISNIIKTFMEKLEEFKIELEGFR